MKKIAVIGVSCSGKSTFGRSLSRKLDCDLIDLDDFYWNPGWVQTPKDVFVEKIAEKIKMPSWIIVGNYSIVQDQVIQAADTVIWLDYSYLTIWSRAFRRTFKRIFLREPCCNGNFETLKLAFFSKDSILLWVYTDYPRKKKRYSKLESRLYRDKRFLRLKNQGQTNEFLSKL